MLLLITCREDVQVQRHTRHIYEGVHMEPLDMENKTHVKPILHMKSTRHPSRQESLHHSNQESLHFKTLPLFVVTFIMTEKTSTTGVGEIGISLSVSLSLSLSLFLSLSLSLSLFLCLSLRLTPKNERIISPTKSRSSLILTEMISLYLLSTNSPVEQSQSC